MGSASPASLAPLSIGCSLLVGLLGLFSPLSGCVGSARNGAGVDSFCSAVDSGEGEDWELESRGRFCDAMGSLRWVLFILH